VTYRLSILFSLYVVDRARVLASWYLLSSCGLFYIVGVVVPSACRCFFRILLKLFYSYFAFSFFPSFDGDAVRVVVLLLGVLRAVVACCCVWLLLSSLLVVGLYFLFSLILPLSFLQAHRVIFCPHLDTSSILTIFFLVLKVPRLLFNSLSAPLTFFLCLHCKRYP